MFEFFTEQALKSILLAQNESKRLKLNYMGVEHILLGLSLQNDGNAAIALNSLEAPSEKLRQEIESRCGFGDEEDGVEIVFTPRAKRVLELAWDEARKLRHNYIGTEHLLLGITREGESVAVQALIALKVDIPSLDKKVFDLLGKKQKDATQENVWT